MKKLLYSECIFLMILAAAIEILRKRIAAGTATFLVKVEAHRGEPANEGPDILADKAISHLKVGKKWCQRTNRAVFMWEKPCRETGKYRLLLLLLRKK